MQIVTNLAQNLGIPPTRHVRGMLLVDTSAPLPASQLKPLKNAIIGNPSAKKALSQAGAIADVVDFLNPNYDDEGAQWDLLDAIRIEAANVVASLAVGSQQALKSLLSCKAHQALLYALSNLPTDATAPTRAALVRALRAVGCATADAVGPSAWGLGRDFSNIREDARIALEDLFQLQALDVYLPLITDPSPHVVLSICTLLATSIRVQPHGREVVEWLSPADRSKELKGKRGWEKPDVRPNAPRRQGGWVVRNLSALLHSKYFKVQEAALSALAAIVKGNTSVANALSKATGTSDLPVMPTIMELCKSRNVGVQLAACLCATHVLRSQSHHSLLNGRDTRMLTLMHVLNHRIGTTVESTHVQSRACFILTALVADDCEIGQAASDCGSLKSLLALTAAVTPEKIQWDDEEPESIYLLREAILTACTALVFHLEDSRQKISTPQFLDALSACLSHPQVGVRHAACQAVRAVCRSVSGLRTNIIDAGLGLRLFEIVRKDQEDRRVRIAALAAMCNLIAPFSPTRAELIERGGIDRLIELVHQPDAGMQVNAAWAIKNCLNTNSFEEKKMVMGKLGWDALIRLLENPNDDLREQGIAIVKNFIHTSAANMWSPEVAFLSQGLGQDRLLDSLESILASDNETLLVTGMETLTTIVESKTEHDFGFCRLSLLVKLRANLQHARVPVRRAAAACVAAIPQSFPTRIRDIRDSGVESTLRSMLGPGVIAATSPSLSGLQMGKEVDREVREHVSRALTLIGTRDSASPPLGHK